MISVRGVHKSFGRVRAVRGVSFDAEPGRVVGLLGANGAGKTTTIRMITGVLPPDAGRVYVAGHDQSADSIAARRAIGYLPESSPLYPEMSVRGYLDYRGRLFGMRRSDRRRAAERCVDRCRLADAFDRRIGQLSKGYRQRVGMAAALLHDPAVLVLDEPASGLDPTQIRQMRSLIRELASDSRGRAGGGKTVVVSSHILPEVEATCDRVVIIARGRVRADGTPGELLASLPPRGEFVVEVGTLEDASEEEVERAAREALARVVGVREVWVDRRSASVSSSSGSGVARRSAAALGSLEPHARAPEEEGSRTESTGGTPVPLEPEEERTDAERRSTQEVRLRVVGEATASAGLRRRIAEAIAAVRGGSIGADGGRLIVTELHEPGPTLEQVFVRVTEADEEDEGRAGGAAARATAGAGAGGAA